MTEVLSQWRRPCAPCSGAVVLALRDLLPGAGWGLVDAYGRPKAPWYAVRRVLAPTAILVHDDGLNGTTVTVVNDAATPLAGNLTVRSWTAQGMLLDDRQAALTVAAHGATEIDLDRFLGVFTHLRDGYRRRRRDAGGGTYLCDEGRPGRRGDPVAVPPEPLCPALARPVRQTGTVGARGLRRIAVWRPRRAWRARGRRRSGGRVGTSGTAGRVTAATQRRCTG